MQATATATRTGSQTASRPATWPPAKFCPRHASVLTGGPVVFTCSTGEYGGHSVTAAQLPEAWG